MGSPTRRQSALTRSIRSALTRDPNTFQSSTAGHLRVFFSLYDIQLLRYANLLFEKLRAEAWGVDENAYRACFSSLEPLGDLGLSGSSFFTTSDSNFLVKAIPRHFEHSFFRRDLLHPYYSHMRAHRSSLLVWISDYVYAPYTTLGSVLRTTPAHHVIMENVLCGRDDDDDDNDRWETFDLKPADYFYPQRDLVPDALRGEDDDGGGAPAVDMLGGGEKVCLLRGDYEDLMAAVRRDTAFLRDMNAVDYSLFLVRFPAHMEPRVVGWGNVWRVGVPSVDGRWKYRVVMLDFFWARHKLHAQAMSGALQTFNMVGRKGPMSITTTAEEYRDKFLAMVEGIMQVNQ